MRKRFLKKIFASIAAATIIVSSTTSQVGATEISTFLSEEMLDERNQSGTNQEQAEVTRDLDTVTTESIQENSTYLEQAKTTAEYMNEEKQEENEESISIVQDGENSGQIIQEEMSGENTNEEQQEENAEVISTAQNEDSLEQTVQEEISEENMNEGGNQEEIDKTSENGVETVEDEIALEKTRVIRTSSYEEYYDENAKLVEQYNPSINSESPYALRRILGKMNQEVNLENYGASVLIIGPDNSFILQFETEEMTEQAFLTLSQLEQLAYCELDTAMPDVKPIDETEQIAADDTSWDIEMLQIDKYIKYIL